MTRRYGKGMAVIASLLMTLALAGNAQATLIDFEDGTTVTPIGSFYAGLGVEFSNAEWINIQLDGMSGVMGVRAPGTFQFFQDNAVEIVFPAGVGNVSMLGADVGANGLRMDAYNAAVGGDLIDFDEAYGTGDGVGQYFTVQTVSEPIYRVELYQIANNVSGEGIVLDDLQFDISLEPATPVPALSNWSLMLMALLMLTIGMVSFRRFQ